MLPKSRHTEQLIGQPIAQQIETHVRALASKPHEAGTDANQIYAPGYNTGYNAIPLPGVREAIERKDTSEVEQMTKVLESTINRVRDTLQQAIAQALQMNKKISV